MDQMRTAPAAAFVMAFRSGSLWEGPGTLGMSHFCEHMMFKGSRSVPASGFWQKVQRNGAITNAFTSRDMTAYFTAVPSCRLAEIIEIDADRMFDPLFDEAEVSSERMVILQERRSACVDSAAGALDELLFLTAFGRHPYRNPITGYEPDIEAFSAEAVRAWHSRFYSPSGTVLVAAGDLDADEVDGQIRRLFGRESDPHLEQVPRGEVLAGRVEAGIPHESDLPRLSLAFSCPPGNEEECVRLELLAIHLAGARSSVLEQILVQGRLALDVSASAMSGICPGLFTVRTTLYPGIEHRVVEEALVSSVRELSGRPLPGGTLEDLKAQYLAFKTLSSAGPVGRAAEVALGTILFGDPGYAEKSAAVARATTSEDLLAAAARWLDPGRMAVVRLTPTGAGASSYVSSPRGAPGEAGDVPAPQVIDFTGLEVPRELLVPPSMGMSDGASETILANGLKIVLKRDRTFPVAALGFVTPIGSLREPERLAGLASMTVETMHYGTRLQGYRDFNYRLERRGSEIQFSPGPEFSAGGIFVLREDLQEAIAVASDLLRRPAFREEDFARVLEEKVNEVIQRRESPFGLALDTLAAAMALDEHSARIPTEATLRSASAGDCLSMHSSCCRPDGTVLSVAGDFEEERVLDLLRASFEDWQRPMDLLPPAVGPVLAPRGTSRALSMEGKEQTAVLIGTPAPPRDSEDSAAFRLLNTILGDGVGSRMGYAIRERLGMSYSAGSEYIPGSGWGRMLAWLSTSGGEAGTGLELVLGMIRELASSDAAEVELQLAKASHTGRHSLTMADLETVASWLARNAAAGRPPDHDLAALRRILDVTPGALREAAARWLDPSMVFVVMAGAEAAGGGPIPAAPGS